MLNKPNHALSRKINLWGFPRSWCPLSVVAFALGSVLMVLSAFFGAGNHHYYVAGHFQKNALIMAYQNDWD